MNKLLIILGPTSTGKTDLAIYLASKLRGEIVSADSRQVYRGLDIGTGKTPNNFKTLEKENGKWIVDKIPIHLYDVLSPNNQYSAADFIKDAKKVIEDILKRGNLPILVGGTGLYIRALVDGLSNLSAPTDKKLREKLNKLSLNKLQQKLKQLSEKKWDNLNYSDKQNPRRLIRAIELEVGKDNTQSRKIMGISNKFDILKIGLTASRQVLYKRSDERIKKRIKEGMLDEAIRLKKEGVSLKRMRQLGLEYGILADYLEGKIESKSDLIKIMDGKIHAYIRRQLTWFKKEKNVHWFDIIVPDYMNEIEIETLDWYNQT